MNYEERYNQALEIAKHYHDRDNIHFLEHIFPELKESEDERIRKELLEHCVNRRDGKQVCVDANDYRRWAAWLEKQGEQKSVKSEQNCYHNDGLYYAIDILEKTFGKVEGYQSDDGKMEHQIAIETVNALYHKKPQSHWKPSKEQMEALKYVVDYFGELTEHFAEYEEIKSLYNDLKSL